MTEREENEQRIEGNIDLTEKKWRRMTKISTTYKNKTVMRNAPEIS